MNSKEALFELYKQLKTHRRTTKQIIENKQQYEQIWKDLNLFEEYKKIEEELGIDLIPLLTVLTNWYVFWKDDGFIYKVQIDSITNCCLKVNTWYYVDSNTIVKRYGDEFTIDFKDYGKTWALTKEELENE